jgi:hypothetical protein
MTSESTWSQAERTIRDYVGDCADEFDIPAALAELIEPFDEATMVAVLQRHER